MTAEGTLQIEYAYDADGIRVAKTMDGDETRYLVDINRQYAQVLEEYDATTGTEVFWHQKALLGQNLYRGPRTSLGRPSEAWVSPVSWRNCPPRLKLALL